MNGGLWECPRLSDPPTEALGVEVAGYADQEAMGDGVDVPPQPAAVPGILRSAGYRELSEVR